MPVYQTRYSAVVGDTRAVGIEGSIEIIRAERIGQRFQRTIKNWTEDSSLQAIGTFEAQNHAALAMGADDAGDRRRLSALL